MGALAIADFADEIAAVARRRLAVLVELRGVLAVGLGGLACIAAVLLFLFSNGRVSLHEIRAVDRTLGADVPYLSALSADHTQVLA